MKERRRRRIKKGIWREKGGRGRIKRGRWRGIKRGDGEEGEEW